MLDFFLWDVFKPDIRIYSPQRFGEGRNKGASFCAFTCSRQFIDWIQINCPKFFTFNVHCINIISDTRRSHSGLVVKVGGIYSVLYTSAVPRGTKFHWINPLSLFWKIEFLNWIRVHI